jgi:hypothetical protein
MDFEAISAPVELNRRASQIYSPSMGLHLGWIPNEHGLRPRGYDQPAPSKPAPDPKQLAALAAAHHARAMWAGLLVAVGLLALAFFCPIAVLAHVRWAWAVGVGLALCCWLPVLLLGRNRRRAEGKLRTANERQATRHAAELAEYKQGEARWAQSEAERIATAPRWLQVAAHDEATRLDVFGGTGFGRQNMVTGLGWELLGQRAVIVLDLSQDRVADGLLAAADRAGIPSQDYELPRDLAATPLLAGLSGDQVASLIVEVVHADDVSATAAGRATDLMILKKIAGLLGPDVSMGRLHAALTTLLGDPGGPVTGEPDPDGQAAGELAGPGLTGTERAGLRTLFGAGFRHQVAGNLVRLAAVVEPLTELGADTGPRSPARLTCLSLADGPRDVAADLIAALVVQWVTRAVSEGQPPGQPAGEGPADGAPRPAVILAGADEQSTRHLARLTAVCERYGIPLVRAFSRLTEESARHMDTRHTAFLRLATRPEALRAAEHIGLERRFVAGRFAQRRSVSRSRTRSTSESVTHTTGRTEGEADTHTTGTLTGQAYSEARVPRHDQQVNVNVENRQNVQNHQHSYGDRDSDDRRKPAGSGAPGQQPPKEDSSRKPSRVTGPRSSTSGGASSSRRTSVTQGGGHGVDVVKTKTQFSATQESDAHTKSWSTTEETSHTSTTGQSRTDGVSVGDEIGYELVYDHKVQPETLMALPEDQMLAPHMVEAVPAASAGPAVTGGRPAATDSKMVALVIDPAVVGSELVAPVHPSEIPAFEPPVPAVSAQVPDYENVPRRASLTPGEEPR